MKTKTSLKKKIDLFRFSACWEMPVNAPYYSLRLPERKQETNGYTSLLNIKWMSLHERSNNI